MGFAETIRGFLKQPGGNSATLSSVPEQRLEELRRINYIPANPPRDFPLNKRWFDLSGIATTELIRTAGGVEAMLLENEGLKMMIPKVSVLDTFVIGGQVYGNVDGDLDLYCQISFPPKDVMTQLHAGACLTETIRDHVRRIFNNVPESMTVDEFIRRFGKENFVDIYLGSNPPDLTDERYKGKYRYFYSLGANSWITNIPGERIIN